MSDTEKFMVEFDGLELSDEFKNSLNDKIRGVTLQELARLDLGRVKLEDLLNDDGFRVGIIIRQDL